MRKFVVAIAALGLLMNGCAWLGFGDDESSASQADPVPLQAEGEPAPEAPAKVEKAAPKAAKKTAKSRGGKSEAQIREELQQMGHKLVAQSARTLLPNKANKKVTREGNGWVATYNQVDTGRVTTELRPGLNGQYVGFIRYEEHIMECRGATREAALSAPCKNVRTRRLNELIRYDGNAWQD